MPFSFCLYYKYFICFCQSDIVLLLLTFLVHLGIKKHIYLDNKCPFNHGIIYEGNLHYEKFADGSVKCIEDEIPFELPEGWEWTRLGNICPYGESNTVASIHISSDAWILDLEDIEKDTGKIIYFATKNERDSKSNKHSFKKGQLLYSKLRPYLNKVVIAPNDGYCTTEILPLELYGDISPYYMQIFLMSETFLSYVNLISYGLKMPRLGTNDGKKALIAIPPIKEQSEIVKKCNYLIAVINNLQLEKRELLEVINHTKRKILDLAIRGKLVSQDPDDEPASVLLERIRAEKEELIKQGKIKRDKKESVIFKGDDNSYYEKIGKEVFCIDEEIPYDIPDTWTWMRLENCCIKEIRRGKSPKYTENSNTLVFAQKCNTKYNGIDISLAQYLDEATLKRYPADEYMQDGDVVINSTGMGTLGRVGVYRNSDNTTGLSIVPDSHVTVIRGFGCVCSHYLYAFMKAHQSELEKKGEGSTNQKELKPLMLKEMLIAIPPLSEQKRINESIDVAFSHFAVIEESLN